MLDENGYPDTQSLEQIKNWDMGRDGVDGLLALIEQNTRWADRQIQRRGKRVISYHYSTGGWSGNESVIKALRANILFWALCWRKHTAGGHYSFRIEIRGNR